METQVSHHRWVCDDTDGPATSAQDFSAETLSPKLQGAECSFSWTLCC